jgi:beta-galactosidase/beta-glucuronidase
MSTPAVANLLQGGRGYPRPQLRRDRWTSLNGTWDFALDPESSWDTPADVRWSDSILVPFSPETTASGIGDTGMFRSCWYRTCLLSPDRRGSDRLILHFGAVDYRATVWVNGRMAATHEGGYTPFSLDLTDLEDPDGAFEIVVRAEDDPLDLEKPRGKQDWQPEPHAIWYPRTSGIWQTVWIEPVPSTSIASIRLKPSLERWEVCLFARVAGDALDGSRLIVRLQAGGRMLADDSYSIVAGEVNRSIALSDPGIDDFRNELLWRPALPMLIDVELTLVGADGAVLDEAASYTAIRSVGVDGNQFMLNGRPYRQRLVLAQGYWPDTGMTAPDDDALRRDLELVKAMGFNGIRMHQKVEDPRLLYWADVLGVLVWAEMPSAYRFTERSVARLTREWADVVHRDVSHPCIVVWVPFNESWGIPDLPTMASQRHYVQALYHLTRTLDPERPVVGNDGWESAATDIVGIHDYDEPEILERRYAVDSHVDGRFLSERPGGRALTLTGHPHVGQPLMLSEFGGLSLVEQGAGWGYSVCETNEELATAYEQLLRTVAELDLFAGFCYTQLTDTYQETNGLLRPDRTPKLPLERIARATLPRRGNAYWEDGGFSRIGNEPAQGRQIER